MPGHMRSSITDHNPQRAATRRNRRWGAIFAAMVALVAAFAVAAQAGPPVMPRPTGPLPTVVTPGPRYVGPTANLTAVANAISSSHKSLEIVVTVNSGLKLTSLVTISIRFINSAGVPKVITQCYVASTGNRFVFHDIEEFHGQPPRRLGMAATLSQDKLRLGDAGYSFTVQWTVDLDPLYDVTISPLQFTLNNDCGRHEPGKNEIHFEFHSPDWVLHKPPTLRMSKGKTTTINQFAWARTEVSQSAGLHWPNYWFWEHDAPKPKLSGATIGGGYAPDTPTGPNLVPGVTGWVGRSLKETHGQNCSADIQFTITYQLRKYAEDSPGGTGCFPSAIQR